MLEFLQHLWLDVAAGNDRDVELCFWQLIGTEEEAGGCDGATGFGDGIRVCGQQFHRLMYFVFAYGDDGIDKTLYVFEIDVADALGAKTVGDGARNLLGGKLKNLAGAQAGLGIGREFGFNTDHLNVGPGQFDCSGDAAD